MIGFNILESLIHPIISGLLTGPIENLSTLPSPLMDILVGDYGFLSMGPFLLFGQLPVVVIYALVLGIYKSTGLLDRTSLAIHPLVKRIGVSGRDVTRIVMGFGCNVPAVISSRSCSSCSRGTTISTISFWFLHVHTNLVHLLLFFQHLVCLGGNSIFAFFDRNIYSLHQISKQKEKS